MRSKADLKSRIALYKEAIKTLVDSDMEGYEDVSIHIPALKFTSNCRLSRREIRELFLHRHDSLVEQLIKYED